MNSVKFTKNNGVGILILDSPKRKNALNSEDMLLLSDILSREAQSDIYALIISSKNPTFLSSFSDIFVAVSNNLLVALAPKIFKNLFIPAGW